MISLIVLAAVYFVPTILAAALRNQTREVFAVNLALGWTVIGWFVALAYAFKHKPDPADAVTVVHHYREPVA